MKKKANKSGKIFFLLMAGGIFLLVAVGTVWAIDNYTDGWQLDPSDILHLDPPAAPNKCWDVNHAGPAGTDSFFVPTRSAAEWNRFIIASPRLENVNMIPCSEAVYLGVCTNGATPGCNGATHRLTANWAHSVEPPPPNPYCDCNGTDPSGGTNDCACWCNVPAGTPCPAPDQEFIYIDIDDNSDFSSPVFRADQVPVADAQRSYTFDVPGLADNTDYYWRINLVMKMTVSSVDYYIPGVWASGASTFNSGVCP